MRGVVQFGFHHRGSVTGLYVNIGSIDSLREHDDEGAV